MSNATKGRKASPVTVAIRKLVKSRKGNITFSVAKPLLAEQQAALGVDVNAEGFEGKFNMTKYLYIKKLAGQGVDWAVAYQNEPAPAEGAAPVKTRKPRAVKVAEPAAPLPPKHKPVDLSSAVAYVEKAGGVKAARTALDARRLELDREAALVAAFEAYVASMNKLTA